MGNLSGFNAETVEPNFGFEPLPAGEYQAAIVNSEMTPTKNGQGKYLMLELEILDKRYAGRKVWDRLCIKHTNALTQRIAQANLSALCRAVGVMQPRDSVELHNLPLVITVACKKRTDTGDINNEVKGYAKREAAVGQPQQAAANDQTPPWAR